MGEQLWAVQNYAPMQNVQREMKYLKIWKFLSKEFTILKELTCKNLLSVSDSQDKSLISRGYKFSRQLFTESVYAEYDLSIY